METSDKPIVVSVPEPRSIDLIFSDKKKVELFSTYDVVETTAADLPTLSPEILRKVRYVIGQPPLKISTLRKMPNLKCIFNVEGNFLNNMPYDYLFEKGVHAVTTSNAFSEPVAEMGLALALCSLRGIVPASLDFAAGTEVYGKMGNINSKKLFHTTVGIIGFGDIGQKLAQLLRGFKTNILVFDPWLPQLLLSHHEVCQTSLDDLMSKSDVIFVLAAVTTENFELLDSSMFLRMKKGSLLILLSRSDIVNFDDLVAAVSSGHIRVASDVYPEEPMPKKHPIRKLAGFLNSAHRAGSLPSTYKEMGELLLEDMKLIDNGLPPRCCKRAERETVSKMRSRPVV